MKATSRRISGLVGLMAALLVCAAAAGPRQGPLRAYLPATGSVPGWATDGGPQEYEGDDLYTYIDGGAEIYQEYGFVRIVVQDYKNASGKSVSLEVFEMKTPAAAYGMYTFKRSGNGRAAELGSGAELESYYLNFWKGRFLVTLTGFDDSRETVNGLLALAGATDARLPGDGGEPPLVGALPPEGLRPGSVKYIKGPLGLNNIYSFATARGLGFAEGVRGLYDDGATLLILDYGSAGSRQQAWSELRAFLGSSERFTRVGAEPTEHILFQDGRGRFVAFGEAGPRLVIGVASSATAALLIVSRAL